MKKLSKNLKNWTAKAISIPLLVGAMMMPSKVNGEGGILRVANSTGSSDVKKNKIKLIESASDGPYLRLPVNSLEIYVQDTNNDRHSCVGINADTNKTYKSLLEYHGEIANGTDNSLYYSYYQDDCSKHPFSSDILLTSAILLKDKVSSIDIRREITNHNGDYFKQTLNIISNAVNGEIYGTNWVHIAPIETTITNLSLNADETLNLGASARPGTVAWPEMSYDLGDTNSWVALTNDAKYLPVTLDNFGEFDSMSWTNLPGNTNANGATFYRLGCDSYNDDSKGLVAGQVGTTSQSNLETKVTDSSVSSLDSDAKTIDMYENPKTGVYEDIGKNTKTSSGENYVPVLRAITKERAEVPYQDLKRVIEMYKK